MSTPLEQIIHSALLSNAALTSLIGTRLYLCQLPPQPTYPCVTYQRIATIPLTTGPQGSGWQGMGWARFSFSGWCNGKTSGAQSDALARALQAAMLTFDASQTPWSPETVSQAPNFLLNRSMTVEPQTDPPLFRARLDYRLLYQEQ